MIPQFDDEDFGFRDNEPDQPGMVFWATSCLIGASAWIGLGLLVWQVWRWLRAYHG